MKWFISQPMKGRKHIDVVEERVQIEQSILADHPEDEIIDSYHKDYTPCDGNKAMKYLARSIEKLADADIAYFAKGWADARGCKIEHDIALAYGLTVVEDNN